ncbi:MAG: aspartate--tRNA ligase [Clostridia bacterium]|nr:aspartate--tRNA ligase [Clostridia bacterium]MEE0839977.1 aspartate--tRNA ligase [Acutalibacteraceae bacterium]
MKRTEYCGLLRPEHIGTQQICSGWVLTKRDMGGIIFIDLRDREGVLQVVVDEGKVSADEFSLIERLRLQSVVSIKGTVRERDEETINLKIATGTIELAADKIELISQADSLPYSIDDGSKVREELRLKYRFLDIRRPELYNNLKFRYKVQKAASDYLDNNGFLYVETPMLTKSTPEGARDYLVPSRVNPGTFYALPQSPQIFKQLLMVGGVDKYYQVARCFRDEDLRADRQPEFTQVDMEMSFVEQEDILNHLEKMFKYIYKETTGKEIHYDFPRLTWQEAMDVYGSDKPDIRFELPIVDVTDIAKKCSFSVFKKVAQSGGYVRAICVTGQADFTRSTIENLTEKAMGYGAKGMAWIAYKQNGEIYSILTKYFTEDEMKELLDAVKAKPGDFILFCADKLDVVRRTLGGLRLDLGDMLGLRRKNDYKFLFVIDFPQFEYSEAENRYVATHHPFTMPYPEDVQYLTTDPGRVRAQAYDVVLNGIELGSGSIRIHDRRVQEKMFEALGFDKKTIDERFGFMVNAFRYGTPPHGGFAFGLDRFVMLMVGADSLRDIIAFPKIKDASCPLTGAPDFVDKAQLDVLGLTEAVQAEENSALSEQKKEKEITIDVENIANLACLYLTDEDKISYAEDMNSIIAFADTITRVDTSNIKAKEHLIPISNVFHDDEVIIHNVERDELLAASPTKTDGYITVPRVVEN